MKSLKWTRRALALAVMTGATWAAAADHADSPSAISDPASDITDLYSWMDGNNAVFILNVTPLATAASKFSDKVQYVIHTESSSAFGKPGTQLDILCTFQVDQTISCWIGDQDYLTGDASVASGLGSASGKSRVFAGLRDDPFYFNFDGFKDAVATVDVAIPSLVFDPAGCPKIDQATSALLVGKLSTNPISVPPGGPPKDFFAGKNVLSIVLSVNKSLVTAGGPIVASWASTNKGS